MIRDGNLEKEGFLLFFWVVLFLLGSESQITQIKPDYTD